MIITKEYLRQVINEELQKEGLGKKLAGGVAALAIGAGIGAGGARNLERSNKKFLEAKQEVQQIAQQQDIYNVYKNVWKGTDEESMANAVLKTAGKETIIDRLANRLADGTLVISNGQIIQNPNN